MGVLKLWAQELEKLGKVLTEAVDEEVAAAAAKAREQALEEGERVCERVGWDGWVGGEMVGERVGVWASPCTGAMLYSCRAAEAGDLLGKVRVSRRGIGGR